MYIHSIERNQLNPISFIMTESLGKIRFYILLSFFLKPRPCVTADACVQIKRRKKKRELKYHVIKSDIFLICSKVTTTLLALIRISE